MPLLNFTSTTCGISYRCVSLNSQHCFQGEMFMITLCCNSCSWREYMFEIINLDHWGALKTFKTLNIIFNCVQRCFILKDNNYRICYISCKILQSKLCCVLQYTRTLHIVSCYSNCVFTPCFNIYDSIQNTLF